ncbi:Phosphatidylserine decarboxylase [hydrothermal vent metagenome]|uniref:Phosphatidylserine decarboxylase n=1 Tax=hydrothermal vent metagenome TaxID=652676 RepID=A0A3B0TN86_9ZZZZ
MKIHQEGKKVIPVAVLIITGIAILLYLLLKQYLIVYFLLAGLLFLAGAVVWFFRDPEIDVSCSINNILSVADGEVVTIEPAFEREYFKEERIQVSVFMSIFNAHINRVPVEGEVVYRTHRNGRFLPAFVAKSSEENERCTTVIRMKDGAEVLVRQIAGLLARRVITYANEGDAVTQKQQLGFIRFGSRVDLFLPKEAVVKVKIHQKTIGGETVIATLN